MKPNGEGPKSPIDRVQRELNKVRSGFENTINIVGETPLGTSVKYVGNVWDDFMNFINRGNVVDLAVGIIMGSAMTSIVNSIVTDIISPFIGLAIGNNLNEAYILLACPTGPNGKRLESCPKYETPKLAAENGAVTWNWGSFVQSVINFFVISLIVFFLVKIFTATFRRPVAPAEKNMKECNFCCNEVPLKARICGFCTSQLLME